MLWTFWPSRHTVDAYSSCSQPVLQAFKYTVLQVTCSPFLNHAVGPLNQKGNHLFPFYFAFLNSLCCFVLPTQTILDSDFAVCRFAAAYCFLSCRNLITSSFLFSSRSLITGLRQEVWISPLETNNPFGLLLLRLLQIHQPMVSSVLSPCPVIYLEDLLFPPSWIHWTIRR